MQETYGTPLFASAVRAMDDCWFWDVVQQVRPASQRPPCIACGQPVLTRKVNAKFCSANCRTTTWTRRNRQRKRAHAATA